MGPSAPLDLYLPHELGTAIDRAHSDAIFARQDLWAAAFVHLLGDGLAGCVIESAGHLSQMLYVAISCHPHTTEIKLSKA